MTRPRPLVEVLAGDEPVIRRHTPPRSVRIPDPIWNAARERAHREGTTVTAVVLRALTLHQKITELQSADEWDEVYLNGWSDAARYLNSGANPPD